MVDQRKKGQRGEYEVRNLLRSATDYRWERIPASGALSYLKGDLWIPDEDNAFCVEVKFYEYSHFNDKVLTNKSNHFVNWWNKLVIQAKNMGQEPILFFKYNRSAIFVSTIRKPESGINYMYTSHLGCYTCVAKDWLEKESVIWIK